ncbi:MAG: FHA domain-containing protein [Deltaproteobacteria bacterium]|nr:FHA domain-containing protein [Deltaproteobacteria bacterium]
MPENDIAIEDTAVSGVHAEIEPEGEAVFYLTDFNSRNGTFVNRELVISRKLRHDDMISIGQHSLVFTYDEGECPVDECEEEISQSTMQIDTPDHRARLARSVAEIAERKKIDVKPEKKQVAALTFLSETRDPIVLTKDVLTMGKNPDCDIVAKGWMMGGIAAEIIKKEGSFYLRAAEGKVRPKVNYRTVSSEILLSEFDVIDIGSISFQFHFQASE